MKKDIAVNQRSLAGVSVMDVWRLLMSDLRERAEKIFDTAIDKWAKTDDRSYRSHVVEEIADALLAQIKADAEIAKTSHHEPHTGKVCMTCCDTIHDEILKQNKVG